MKAQPEGGSCRVRVVSVSPLFVQEVETLVGLVRGVGAWDPSVPADVGMVSGGDGQGAPCTGKAQGGLSDTRQKWTIYSRNGNPAPRGKRMARKTSWAVGSILQCGLSPTPPTLHSDPDFSLNSLFRVLLGVSLVFLEDFHLS